MNHHTFKLGFLGILFFHVLSFPGAQQVNRDEIEKTRSRSVNFLNYEGPYARIDTRVQIRDIGYLPGASIRSGGIQSGLLSRYFVIHSMTAPEGDRLDADIFGLGVDVGVDHIRNLRLIIQGFLEGAYGYASQDAALLAEYVTIYNAVYRGNWEYFSTRYKTPVVANLDPAKVGLSVRFDEWPGQTLMLIPLALGTPGSLSALDTSALTDPAVINQLRTQDGQGMDQRKAMVDLKEREVDEAEQRAAIQRQEAEAARQRLAQERAALEAERAAQQAQGGPGGRAGAGGQGAGGQGQGADGQGGPGAGGAGGQGAGGQDGQGAGGQGAGGAGGQGADGQGDAAGGQQLAAAQPQDARDAALAEREAALNQQREEAARAEQFAEQKAAEAQRERQEIAQDQQGTLARPEDQSLDSGAGIIGVQLLSANSPLGRAVRLDPASGRPLRTSGMATVNARTIAEVNNRIYAIAGENQGNSAIRVVEINRGTLEMVNQGNEDIHPQSLIWAQGNNLFVISGSGNVYYLVRYNLELQQQARSAIPIHPYGSPTFQGDVVLIQQADGSAVLLNVDTLVKR